MRITLDLINPVSNDSILSKEILDDMDRHARILITRSDLDDMDDNEHLYSVWLEYGESRSLLFEVFMDDLELFAYTLLKDMKMTRRDYKKQLKERISKGEAV